MMGGAWCLPGRTGVRACVRRCYVSRTEIPQLHWVARTNERAPAGGWWRNRGSRDPPPPSSAATEDRMGANLKPAGNPKRWLLFSSHAFPSYVARPRDFIVSLLYPQFPFLPTLQTSYTDKTHFSLFIFWNGKEKELLRLIPLCLLYSLHLSSGEEKS